MPLYVRKQIYIFVAPDTPSIFDFLCPEKDFISIINITFTYNLGRLQLGSNIIAACGISGPSRNNSKLRLHDADTDYGNTGCGVFKWGIQNWKDFCIKINIPKGNY